MFNLNCYINNIIIGKIKELILLITLINNNLDLSINIIEKSSPSILGRAVIIL